MGSTLIPIIVVVLVALSEVILSLRMDHLPAYSVEELNEKFPKLKNVAFVARSLPVVVFGLAILVIVARVGRRLTIEMAVGLMILLLMFWALSSAIMEVSFGLTYRLVRRRPLPGEQEKVKREQYRVGPEVKQNGWYRFGVLLLALILIVIMLL